MYGVEVDPCLRELHLPCHCSKCPWRGLLSEANRKPDSLILCPLCSASVEERPGWLMRDLNVQLDNGDVATVRCWMLAGNPASVSFDPLPPAVAAEFEVRVVATRFLVKKEPAPAGMWERFKKMVVG